MIKFYFVLIGFTYLIIHSPVTIADSKKSLKSVNIIAEDSTQMSFEDSIVSAHDSDGYLYVNFSSKKRAYQTQDEQLIEKVRTALADKRSVHVTVDTENDTLLKIKISPANENKNSESQ